MFDDPDGSVTGGEEGCNTYIRGLEFMLFMLVPMFR